MWSDDIVSMGIGWRVSLGGGWNEFGEEGECGMGRIVARWCVLGSG